jgi:hypothetical protein
MKQRTLRDVKKDIAAAFPDVEFTWTTEGRGQKRGPCCRWLGGPSQEAVRANTNVPWGSWRVPPKIYYFIRTMTPAEQAAHDAEQEAKHKTWLSDAPAREAHRKAEIAANRRAGAAQAVTTRAAKKEIATRLAAYFPGVEFTITILRGGEKVSWVDGPSVPAVQDATLGWPGMRLTRHRTPECTAREQISKTQEIAAARLQRRLERSKNRVAAIEKALSRPRRNALGPRRRFISENQLCLL